MARIGAMLMIAASIVALTACAIPYQDPGPVGRFLTKGGIDEVQLGPAAYQITVQGNALTPQTRVQDFVLLRASELALRNGYRYFQIQGSANTSRTSIEQVAVGGGFAPASVFRPGVAAVVILTNSPGIDAAMINSQLAPKYGVATTAAAYVPPTPAPNAAAAEQTRVAILQCGIAENQEEYTAAKTLDQVHRTYSCARDVLSRSPIASLPKGAAFLAAMNAQEVRWEKVITRKMTSAEARAEESEWLAKMASGH